MNDDQNKDMREISEEEAISRIGALLEMADHIPHERIMDGKQSQILYAVYAKVKELLEICMSDAELNIRYDPLMGIDGVVEVICDAFDVDTSHMGDLAAVFENCSNYSSYARDDGKMYFSFTIPNVMRILPPA